MSKRASESTHDNGSPRKRAKVAELSESSSSAAAPAEPLPATASANAPVAAQADSATKAAETVQVPATDPPAVLDLPPAAQLVPSAQSEPAAQTGPAAKSDPAAKPEAAAPAPAVLPEPAAAAPLSDVNAKSVEQGKADSLETHRAQADSRLSAALAAAKPSFEWGQLSQAQEIAMWKLHDSVTVLNPPQLSSPRTITPGSRVEYSFKGSTAHGIVMYLGKRAETKKPDQNQLRVLSASGSVVNVGLFSVRAVDFDGVTEKEKAALEKAIKEDQQPATRSAQLASNDAANATGPRRSTRENAGKLQQPQQLPPPPTPKPKGKRGTATAKGKSAAAKKPAAKASQSADADSAADAEDDDEPMLPWSPASVKTASAKGKAEKSVTAQIQNALAQQQAAHQLELKQMREQMQAIQQQFQLQLQQHSSFVPPAPPQQQNPAAAATVATAQGKRLPRPARSLRAASPSPVVLARAGMAMIGKWLRAFIH